MQYITNIVFWLQASLAAAAASVGVATILALLCLFGIGVGVGKVWNRKWKPWRELDWSVILISLLFAMLTSTLGMAYMGMGFVKENTLAPVAKKAVIEDCCKYLADNNRLLESAFREGLKSMISSGVDVDSIDPETMQFVIPGETEEARRTNKELFLSGVAKVLAKGEPVKKKSGKSGAPGLDHQPPFSFGFEPTFRDSDGSMFAAFEESLQGREEQPISVEDPFWYNCMARYITENSFKNLVNTVGKDIDSQRTNLLILLVILLCIQGALITWLALVNIRPRYQILPEVKSTPGGNV